MAGKGKARHQVDAPRPQSAGRGRPPRSEPRLAPWPARSEPDRIHGQGRGRSGGGRGRGGASSGAGEVRQGSVKDMIQRLDGHRRDSDRHASPSKRPRTDSCRDSSVSSSTSVADLSGQPLTERSLTALMRTMSRQIRDDIAAQFSALREELAK